MLEVFWLVSSQQEDSILLARLSFSNVYRSQALSHSSHLCCYASWVAVPCSCSPFVVMRPRTPSTAAPTVAPSPDAKSPEELRCVRIASHPLPLCKGGMKYH